LTLFNSKISRVLVLYIVLFSSLITLLLTLIQLKIDYNYGIDVIEQRLDQIKLTNIDSITQSLWTMDNTAIQLQVDGLARLPDIIYVELNNNKNKIISVSGNINTENIIEKTFPLHQLYRGKETDLGNIRVVATKENVYQRLMDTVLVILVSQGVKTFVVSIFILVIFNILVTRHIFRVADYFELLNIRKKSPHLNLHRTVPSIQKGDELDRLTKSINKMVDDSRKDYEKLIESQHELSESEARFSAIFNSITDSIIVFDVDRKIVIYNPAFNEKFLYEKGELLGGTSELLYEDNEDFKRREACSFDANDKEEYQLYEVNYIRKDGSVFEGETLSGKVKLADDELIGYLCIIRDVTARNQEEKEKQKLKNNLQQSQKMEAIGFLAGGIAHDFNNVLASMLGYTELASQLVVKAEQPTIHKYLSTVLESGYRATDLIKQLLAFSRSMPSETMKIALPELIQDVIKMLKPMLPSTIELVAHLDEGVPCVRFDVTQMHQILINLCVNARDAMDAKGSIAIHLSYQEGVDDVCRSCHEQIEGDFVKLSVTDTGGGIEQDNIEHMFEPFHTTKEVGKGTGMGLSVAHGILHKHNSHINVDSTLGVGTRFNMYIPPDYSEGLIDQEKEISKKSMKSEVSNINILAVDDEELLVMFIKDFLECYGYSVTTCTDASEALKMIESDPNEFDLLITDQTMPGMTGIELIEEVRKLKKDVPIILCSGYNDVVNKKDIEENDISYYLQKPVDNSQLLKYIDQLLS